MTESEAINDESAVENLRGLLELTVLAAAHRVRFVEAILRTTHSLAVHGIIDFMVPCA